MAGGAADTVVTWGQVAAETAMTQAQLRRAASSATLMYSMIGLAAVGAGVGIGIGALAYGMGNLAQSFKDMDGGEFAFFA